MHAWLSNSLDPGYRVLLTLDKGGKKEYCYELSSNQEGMSYDHSDCGETHRGTSFGKR
jgi:hypothetical protein